MPKPNKKRSFQKMDAGDPKFSDGASHISAEKGSKLPKKRRRMSAEGETNSDVDQETANTVAAGAPESAAATPEASDAETQPPSPDSTTCSNSSPAAEDPQLVRTTQAGLLTEHSFASLDICDNLKKALVEEMKLTRMTSIQSAAIPHLLQGRDVLGAAKTGSGKTLAFLVPAMDLLYKLKITPNRGTVVLILTPTRELAIQIYSVAVEAGAHLSQTKGVVVGGLSMKVEAKKLTTGVNLLVATPGRLLDHLKNTKTFVVRNLQMFVLDEADRMLAAGFRPELTEILQQIPKKRQTALFSATQSAAVNDLIRLSMSPGAVNIRVEAAEPTVAGVTQGYIFCQGHERLAILTRLIKKKLDKAEKVMVFFSSCNSVEFHHDLFNFLGLKCEAIHGKKKQEQRTAVYNRFCTAESGVLLCTSVAARGLDFPRVDWIIQYDPPDDITEYIHRIGRTGRGVDGTGAGLLFVLPEEVGFIRKLVAAGTKPTEFEVKKNGLSKNYEAIASIVRKNFHLAKSAREAYKGYILAYKSHALKDVFDLGKLDISEVAKSFGMEVPPRVEVLGGIKGSSSGGAPPSKKKQRRR